MISQENNTIITFPNISHRQPIVNSDSTSIFIEPTDSLLSEVTLDIYVTDNSSSVPHADFSSTPNTNTSLSSCYLSSGPIPLSPTPQSPMLSMSPQSQSVLCLLNHNLFCLKYL